MHVILLILKILGIILLCILGLLLLLLFLILASPFSYDLSGEYHKDKPIKGKLFIRYLFRMLRIQAIYKNGELKLRVKLMWFTLLQQRLGNEDRAQEPKSVKTPEASGSSEKNKQPSEAEESQNADAAAEKIQQPVSDDATDLNAAAEGDTVKADDDAVTADDNAVTADGDAAMTDDGDVTTDIPEKENADGEKGDSSLSHRSEADSVEPEASVEDIFPDEEPEETEHGTDRLARLMEYWDKLQYWYDFLTQPSMQKLFYKIKKRLFKILRHLLPKSLDADAILGSDNPRTVGKIMEAYAFLFAFYGDHISLKAEYEQERIDLRGKLQGYIVPGYLLWQLIGIAVALLLNKISRRFIFKHVFHKGD